MFPRHVRRGLANGTFSLFGKMIYGSITDDMSRQAARVLSSSLRDGRRFFWFKLRHDTIALMEWMALGRRSLTGLTRDIRHVETDHDDDLRWLAKQRGAVVGTMHFGPYALGLVWLIHRYFQSRKVIIFKNDDNDEEVRAMARLDELGAEVVFVSPDAVGDFPRLVKQVREGAIVIIMVDMPPEAGRSDAFDLLGRHVAIATGAVDLAALARVPLMLLRVREGKARDRIEIGEIFDVARHDEGSRTRAASRITRFVADTIHHHPEQWHMWERFEDYLSPQQRTES